MAKLRSVNTHFWDDSYISELDPIEKLLFLYLLTNPLTTLAGCYEISLRQMAFDTGIDREMVTKILTRFEAGGRILYRGGWLVMLNFIKHQHLNKNMGTAAAKELNTAPAWVRDAVRGQLETIPEWFGTVKEPLKEGNRRELNRREDEGNTTEAENRVCVSGEEKEFFHSFTTGLLGLLNLVTLPNEHEWYEAGQWAYTNKFTADQFLECYRLLTKQEWRTSPVKARHVVENLPNLSKLRGETRPEIPLPTIDDIQRKRDEYRFVKPPPQLKAV